MQHIQLSETRKLVIVFALTFLIHLLAFKEIAIVSFELFSKEKETANDLT